MDTVTTKRTPAKTRTRNFFDHRPVLRASSNHNHIEYKQVATQPRRTMHGTPRCGDNVIADLDASGNLVRSYCTPMLDSNVSTTSYGTETVTSYYNQDERQSVVDLTNSAGVVVNDYAYSAYGDKVDALTGGDVEQRYSYTGRELSDTTGDFYFRYRWYGAASGSFMSRDPSGYVDGQGLYNGYFAMRMVFDPEGLVIRYEVVWTVVGYHYGTYGRRTKYEKWNDWWGYVEIGNSSEYREGSDFLGYVYTFKPLKAPDLPVQDPNPPGTTPPGTTPPGTNPPGPVDPELNPDYDPSNPKSPTNPKNYRDCWQSPGGYYCKGGIFGWFLDTWIPGAPTAQASFTNCKACCVSHFSHNDAVFGKCTAYCLKMWGIDTI